MKPLNELDKVELRLEFRQYYRDLGLLAVPRYFTNYLLV